VAVQSSSTTKEIHNDEHQPSSISFVP